MHPVEVGTNTALQVLGLAHIYDRSFTVQVLIHTWTVGKERYFQLQLVAHSLFTGERGEERGENNMHYALCIMHCALCIMNCTLCIVQNSLSFEVE